MRKVPNDLKNIVEILAALTDKEIAILIYRYSSNKTIYEVGKIFNITGERVRQIEDEALFKINEIKKSQHQMPEMPRGRTRI